MAQIKLHFDHSQEHQLAAIDAVCGLFEKLPRNHSAFALSEETIPNLPAGEHLDEELLLENLRRVQAKNGLPASTELDVDDGLVLEGVGDEGWRYPAFTVEMETGTGKTYTYLRTIYELKKLFGFRKFIIIVPSVAVYKGVIKSIEMTRDHFKGIYNSEHLGLIDYDSSEISKLRDFATSQFPQVMVMTMAAFNKSTNNIYKRTEKLPGERIPVNHIQETRPILILDESQNYSSALSLQALRSLHPLLAVKYSATPGYRAEGDLGAKLKYDNLVYRLTPVAAFRKNLVKRVEVFGVTEEFNPNAERVIALRAINPDLTASLTLMADSRGQLVQKDFRLRKGDDLSKKTENPHYKGFSIEEINRKKGIVVFTNGFRALLDGGGQVTASKEEIWRVQIEEAVRRHIERQEQLLPHGIKVLSLFFVESVAQYMDEKGVAKRLFDEAFEKLKSRSSVTKKLSAQQVREAYFAKKITKTGEELIDIDEQGRNAEQREAARRAFELIMSKKEQLLSFDEPVAFIFAHSALREGWDNPNVFQICTLRETGSDREKRQSVGRGMRLSVNQAGERVFDPDINVLTVIANESYDAFCRGLQSEYEIAGEAVPPKPSDARRAPARRNEELFNSKEFQRFWSHLNKATRYELVLNEDDLFDSIVARMSRERIPPPRILVRKGKFVITNFVVQLLKVSSSKAQLSIEISDTLGNENSTKAEFALRDDLAQKLKDERLRGYMLTEFLPGGKPRVVFGNGKVLTPDAPISFDSEAGQRLDERTVIESEKSYPVFNLISRAAHETALTRQTILKIFRALPDDRKREIFVNPEGFAGVFTGVIREVLADHMARHVVYELDGAEVVRDIETFFPKMKNYPQKELIAGSGKALYDHIQIDSDVEQRFVEQRLKEDENVVLYFKFPTQFKVEMPTTIGNYVPDWGVIRMDAKGDATLELVRETKGAVDDNRLQFPNEKRKIWCAQKHFEKLGIRYRKVTPDMMDWWQDAPAGEIELPLKASRKRA